MACRHMTNYTAAHESRAQFLGEERLNYPRDHVEADNRLSWFLGRLDEAYGDDAFYVHLIRDQQGTAGSYNERWTANFSIMRAYSYGILKGRQRNLDVAMDYWTTVNANIRHFLRDKSNTMVFRLEHAEGDFREFWDRIDAQGNLDAALAEWRVRHNRTQTLNLGHRAVRKLKGLVKQFPTYLRDS